MSVIANKISSDSRSFLAGVKSSTAKNDRTLNSTMNLSMRLDGKEIELSQKRRMLNVENFVAPQQISDKFDEGYIGGYQTGVKQGIKQGIQLGQSSILNPLNKFFGALPILAVSTLSQVPGIDNLLDIFLPNRPEAEANEGTGRDGQFGEGTYGEGRPSDSLPYTTNEDGEVVPIPQSDDTYVYPDGGTLSPGDTVGMDLDVRPQYNAFNPENMGRESSNTQILVVKQQTIVTKEKMGNVVNNGSQLAVIVSGDQRRSDFINFAQRIT